MVLRPFYSISAIFNRWKTVDKNLCASESCLRLGRMQIPVEPESRPRGYKNFIMHNSAEHEILNADKYKRIKNFSTFQAQLSLERYFFPAHKS